MIRPLIACVCALSLTAAAHAQSGGRAYPPEFEGAETHEYKRVGDVPLNLYVFEPAEKAAAPRPAIVFFFGGGWSSGSPQQFEQHCRYLASRGMVAITADYRVAKRHGVLAVDCVRDAKSAIRWVRQHASELGVDPHRIVAAGGSAGGHLAACTAVLADFDEPAEDASISSKPAAVVMFNPVLSFIPPDPSQADRRIKGYAKRLGVEPIELSPAQHVAAGAPPALVMVGTEDYVLDGVKQFAANMEKAGNRCDLKLYEGRDHGFFNLGRSPEDVLGTIEEMDAFLASLGYIDGLPAVAEYFKDKPFARQGQRRPKQQRKQKP